MSICLICGTEEDPRRVLPWHQVSDINPFYGMCVCREKKELASMSPDDWELYRRCIYKK